MTFYNTNNQEISQLEWIDIFQPYYYLGGPTYKNKINSNNQTSKFIEEKIEQILELGLQPYDLKLIIAWKIGVIDHKASEHQQNIVYKNQFDQNFLFQTRFYSINANNIINYCQNNFDNLFNNNDTGQLFSTLLENSGQGIGIVYCLSLLYFFTKGKLPIYDQYAHIALDAISLNKLPSEVIQYRQISKWQHYYEKYVKKIEDIFGTKNIEREIDQSLWVYGHFYRKV